MADTAMVTLPSGGPAVSPFGAGPPTGGLAALKYAAQADMFQDDPNFYTWLEDWIGKQDEETVMMDAFNTLNDYGMQFEFQQQQQQLKNGAEMDADAGAGAADTAEPGTASGVPATHQQQHLHGVCGGDSSCASLNSRPSSDPSEDNSLAFTDSPSDSLSHSSAQLRALTTTSLPAAAAPSTGLLAGLAGELAGNGASTSASAPFDAASFTMPFSRAQGLLTELNSYFIGGTTATASSDLMMETSSAGARVPSHGTVSSYVGTPPPAAAAPSMAPAGPPDQPAISFQGFSGALPGRIHHVPSLEQLIAKAICGNGSGFISAAVGAVGGLAEFGTLAAAALSIAPHFARNSSSGSGDCALAPMAHSTGDRGSGGSCRDDSCEPHRLASMSGAPGSAAQDNRPRRKSSSLALSGAHLTAHGHGHGHGQHHGGGIPVSHAHGHAHVGKAALTSGARNSGGMGASGRPTRSARTKAVFAALEAEVAGKLSELEVLQHEHATLTQRVEILEVAVERQSVVLSLLNGVGSFASAAARGAPHAGEAAVLGQSAAAAGGAAGSSTSAAGAAGAGAGAVHLGPRLGVGLGLTPSEVLAAGPGSPEAAQLLDWARRCTMETYMSWYKEHLQNLSLALLALEDSVSNPLAEARLVQLVAACWVRTTLVSVFQPLTQLRLKGLNFETNAYVEPTEQHWMDVIKFMTVGPGQVAEMENLFHSYTLLHGSFRAELQDTQRDLAELVERQDTISRKHCSDSGLAFMLQQTALLKRVRSILQKTHLLYSCTIGVAAMRILKPKEFAKCCVQSYPYFPCGPSLMRACFQLRAMKAIWGVSGGCEC